MSMRTTCNSRKPVLFTTPLNLTDGSPMDSNMIFIFTPEGEMFVYRKTLGGENFIASYLRKLKMEKKKARSLYDEVFYDNECNFRQRGVKGHVDITLKLKYIGYSYDFQCPDINKFEREPFTGDYYIWGVSVSYIEVYKYDYDGLAWITVKEEESGKDTKVELSHELIQEIRRYNDMELMPYEIVSRLLEEVFNQVHKRENVQCLG